MGMHSDILPNETIYIKNLLKNLSSEEIKRALYAVFGQFGKIIKIIVSKTKKLKGKAWVIFADVSSSSHALRSMQNFLLFEKEMIIKYSINKSRAIDIQYGKPKMQKSKEKNNLTMANRHEAHALSDMA